MASDRTVRVTVTVEILGPDGTVETTVTNTVQEPCGNPLWTCRVAHRVTESISDTQRVMLGARYSDIGERKRA